MESQHKTKARLEWLRTLYGVPRLLISGKNPLESYRLCEENAVTSVTFTSYYLRHRFFFRQDKNTALAIPRESYAEGLCLKSSTVQRLIHTGLEPGDRWLGESRETVLTVSSSSRTTKL